MKKYLLPLVTSLLMAIFVAGCETEQSGNTTDSVTKDRPTAAVLQSKVAEIRSATLERQADLNAQAIPTQTLEDIQASDANSSSFEDIECDTEHEFDGIKGECEIVN